jgi:predicted nuclease of predicted toxin-antitoxin system
MQLKLDENLDVKLADWLATRGHDAKTVRDERLSGAPDERVFVVARTEKRCLITLDLDFSDPLRFSPVGSAGILVLRVPVPSMAMIKLLLEQAIARAEVDSPKGQIWIVEPGRVRIWESWDPE